MVIRQTKENEECSFCFHIWLSTVWTNTIRKHTNYIPSCCSSWKCNLYVEDNYTAYVL